MKLFESVPGETDFINDANFDTASSKKIKEFLAEEKSSLQKKNKADDIPVLPAPFYDELHFANYE